MVSQLPRYQWPKDWVCSNSSFIESHLNVLYKLWLVYSNEWNWHKAFEEDLLKNNIWGKVFKNRPYHFKFFKGCLPQILLGPFLNTLPHLRSRIYIYNVISVWCNFFGIRYISANPSWRSFILDNFLVFWVPNLKEISFIGCICKSYCI